MLLEHKFESGEFAIIAEMEPPKGTQVADLVAHAKRVKDRVAAFLVPEMNQAVMRMSALGGAMVLQAQGMDAVMQVCCRDRNRLALQGDLLAAAACGVRIDRGGRRRRPELRRPPPGAGGARHRACSSC